MQCPQAGNIREGPDLSAIESDPVAAYFEAQGIAWKELSSAEQEKLIRAALSLKFRRYVELRTFQQEEDLSPAGEGLRIGVEEIVYHIACGRIAVFRGVAILHPRSIEQLIAIYLFPAVKNRLPRDEARKKWSDEGQLSHDGSSVYRV